MWVKHQAFALSPFFQIGQSLVLALGLPLLPGARLGHGVARSRGRVRTKPRQRQEQCSKQPGVVRGLLVHPLAACQPLPPRVLGPGAARVGEPVSQVVPPHECVQVVAASGLGLEGLQVDLIEAKAPVLPGPMRIGAWLIVTRVNNRTATLAATGSLTSVAWNFRTRSSEKASSMFGLWSRP